MPQSELFEEVSLPSVDASPETALPMIICPLSRLGDEIAGDTPSQIALNLLAGTRIARSFHSTRLRRRCPDLARVFAPFQSSLTPEARQAIRRVEQIHQEYSRKKETRS